MYKRKRDSRRCLISKHRTEELAMKHAEKVALPGGWYDLNLTKRKRSYSLTGYHEVKCKYRSMMEKR